MKKIVAVMMVVVALLVAACGPDAEGVVVAKYH